MEPPLIRDWPGSLDVGGLAADSVEQARRAVERVAGLRGIDAEVGTSAALIVGAFDAIGHLRIDGRPAPGWAPLSGFVEAADGWVRLHGNFPHHAEAIRASLQVGGPEELAAAVSRLPAAQVEERVQAAGGIATVVRSPAQWEQHPHHRATCDVPWHRVLPGAERRVLGAAQDVPLQGVRVLDLTRVIAGPVCSQLLGCLGSEVLRIDPPHCPELLEHHLSTGMGKRSAQLDLGKHLDVLHEHLLPGADVVLLGYRPGSLDRFGLAPAGLAQRFPHLVIGSLSAWGEHGPWGSTAGFDSIVQAATGIASVCGGEDGRPGALPVQALDHSSGYLLAARVIDLLADARGGRVHVNLLGAARELLRRAVPERADGDALREDDTAQAGNAIDAGAGGAGPDSGGAGPATVDLDTPHGRVRTVPVPLTLDGAPISGPIAEYGTARPHWDGGASGAVPPSVTG